MITATPAATDEVRYTSDVKPDECWWRLTSTAGGEFYEVHAWNASNGLLLPADVFEFTVGRPRRESWWNRLGPSGAQ